MALGLFYAGPYTASYDPAGVAAAVSLGITRQGYFVGVQHRMQNIDESDTYGRTLIEQIYQGTLCTLDMELLEWSLGLRSANPFQTTAMATGAGNLSLGTIGTLGTDSAGIIILTSTAGTPSAAAPATWTATFALIHEDFDLRWLYGPTHRTLPMRFRILPYSSSGVKFFVTT